MLKKKDLMSELTVYIKNNLKKGYTKESLKWALINQGYSRFEVTKSFERAENEMANEAPILKTRPQIEYKVIEQVSEQKEEKSF